MIIKTKHSLPAALLLLFLFLSSFTSSAQGEITGDWEGAITVQGTTIALLFQISEENGAYSSTMDSPSQGAIGIPMDTTTFVDNKLTIEFNKAGITYTGTLKNEKIAGTFNQGAMEVPLELTKTIKSLPGNPDLVTSEEDLKTLASFDAGDYKYDVKDYFAKPKARTFRISPNGNYLSYREKDDNNKSHVYIKKLSTQEVLKVVEEKEELVRDYIWANNERLIYVMDKGGNENYHLFAVNIDGTNQKELTPYPEVRASIIEDLKADKDHMIISMNKNKKEVFEPYKINITTGEITQIYENTDVENPITSYNFDKEGTLKAFTRLRDGVNSDLYYLAADNTYKLIKKLNWKDSFYILAFNYTTDNPDDAYVASNLDSDKSKIYLYDFAKGKVKKELFANDQYDISNITLSRKRNYELDKYSYEGEKNQIVPVSSYYKKLHKKITNKFADYQYYIADHTDEEDKYLLYITSDKLFGAYYSYDVKKDTFELLYNLMPQLEEGDMSEMRPITFKSRDGLMLTGYITLPKEAVDGKKVPLIVNPHGGPQGVRDSWGFNPEAQLFASRGYATLQVNFRISGGFGKKFLESGFKQIGRKAMDDVEDGLKYVIDKGWIDSNNVAIYGGSHGGYAVLRGLTKTPDLYTCGVDYVGVSNLFTFMKTIPPYWKPYLKIIKEVWYDEDIAEEKAIMEEVSPVYQIDKIKKPLFVVQGANDPRVNIDESDQIVKALRSKGFDVPYMVRYDEGHGFAKEENSIAMYRAMLGFYAKHFKESGTPIKG